MVTSGYLTLQIFPDELRYMVILPAIQALRGISEIQKSWNLLFFLYRL